MRRLWRSPLFRYLLLHAVAAGGIALFFLLDAHGLLDRLLLCPFHLLGLYCPTCGMTRAAWCLLRLDLGGALRYHPGLLALAAALLYYEGLAVATLLGRRTVGRRAWLLPLLFLGGLLLLYAIWRNVLLLGYGIDPIGDFL